MSLLPRVHAVEHTDEPPKVITVHLRAIFGSRRGLKKSGCFEGHLYVGWLLSGHYFKDRLHGGVVTAGLLV